MASTNAGIAGQWMPERREWGMRTAFVPPLAATGEGAGRRFFLGLARGDVRRAIGCYGSKPWCRAGDQSIPPHGRRQPDHAEPILIVANIIPVSPFRGRIGRMSYRARISGTGHYIGVKSHILKAYANQTK